MERYNSRGGATRLRRNSLSVDLMQFTLTHLNLSIFFGKVFIETEISSLLRKKALSAVLKSSLTESQRKKVIRMSCTLNQNGK